jgi:hypothetical protein
MNKAKKDTDVGFLRKFFITSKKTKIAIVGILLLTLVIFIWGKSFVALAGELIDSFTDTSRVSDTWQVDVDTGAGEVKLSVRTCDSAVWICASDDVCENDFGDGAYIVVASTTISGTKQWKNANTACDLPECLQDGGQDGDNLDADNTINYTDYPARQACKNIGGRLPTVSELQCIYANQASFNGNFGTGYHWSSTEYSDTNARLVNFTDGFTGGFSKTFSYSVRCVRGW